MRDDPTIRRPRPAIRRDGAPAFAPDAAAALRLPAFRLRGGLCDAWFERRSDVLYVTFDNLGSFGEYDPPQPWLQARVARQGFSILGILPARKDWYRNPDAPALVATLRDAGLFAPFAHVIFAGASMGAFAALTLSSLVPGSTVLAFAPQTTLSRRIAPFETRYRYARRTWDWTTPDHLDAARDAGTAARVWLLYDPFVPEDAAHAARLAALPHVVPLRLGHCGHRLIRRIKDCGALDDLIGGVGRRDLDLAALRQKLRARRDLQVWQRALLAAAEARGRARGSGALAAQAQAAIRARRKAGTAAQETADAA
jgi:hypothetical protein